MVANAPLLLTAKDQLPQRSPTAGSQKLPDFLRKQVLLKVKSPESLPAGLRANLQEHVYLIRYNLAVTPVTHSGKV